jgi:hypothetical protein
MTLNGDPRGGIDNIYAASIKHSSPDDAQYLKDTFESYTTGAKSEGIPNGQHILTKWNAQLAGEEILRSWVSLSEGALQKFMADHFDQKWHSYDNFDKGEIDETDGPHFIRELFSSMAPPTQVEVNPYEIKEEKKSETDDHHHGHDDEIVVPEETATATSRRSISGGGTTTSETTTTTKEPAEGSTKSTTKAEASSP